MKRLVDSTSSRNRERTSCKGGNDETRQRRERKEERVIIIIGYFEVLPEDREQFLAARVQRMAHSRSEEGCFEFAFCADPVVESRVILTERWESREALYRHLEGTRAEGPVANSPAPTGPPRIMVYDVTNESEFVPLKS